MVGGWGIGEVSGWQAACCVGAVCTLLMSCLPGRPWRGVLVTGHRATGAPQGPQDRTPVYDLQPQHLTLSLKVGQQGSVPVGRGGPSLPQKAPDLRGSMAGSSRYDKET